MLIKKIKFILSLASIILISSCASFYDKDGNENLAYNKPTQIDKTFNLSGRFNIKTSKDNYYGNFAWDKTESNEILNLNTPLGSTVARITIDNNLVTLQTKDEELSGNDLDEMMQKNLGFSLPLDSMHAWVQGIPLNQYPHTPNTNGFSQLGWKIEYLSWSDNNHPALVRLSDNDLIVKLIIKWESN